MKLMMRGLFTIRIAVLALYSSVAIAFSPITNNQQQQVQKLQQSPTSTDSVLDGDNNNNQESRRRFLSSTMCIGALVSAGPFQVDADDSSGILLDVIVAPTGDVKKIFNEGRALEAQGNILAAQRLFTKVTKIAPRFIYGWSNLGNTLVAQGQLSDGDEVYSKAISLCGESIKQTEQSFGTKRCDDMYILLLNRGSVRLNNGRQKEALADLQQSNTLRAQPDAVILQNLARAQEINSYYEQADKSYTTAISMTADEVNPFWLRSAMVKQQLGDLSGAFDLMRRVENRFPEAPEVRAAYAVMLLAKGDEEAARKKYLEMPDRQQEKYTEEDYVDKVIVWPPLMKEGLGVLQMKIRRAGASVGPG